MSDNIATQSGNLVGRLIALAIAIALGVLGYWVWQQNIDARAPDPIQAETLPEIGMADAVSACIEERVREINAMAEDGLMGEEAAELSRQRARTLCIQRN